MNKIWVGCVVTSLFIPVANAQPTLSLEERLALMEQRLKATERRAENAEAEIRELKRQESRIAKTSAPTPAAVPALAVNNDVDLKFYGDVEFNMDGASRTGSLTSVKTSANKNWAPGDKERWDINGRILLGFDGLRKGANGKYSGFSVQPLADMTGKMNLDDAVFFFGQENDWKIKIGRFEAYDMFPLNQDTFIEYSGNTANDLYSDGYGYIYMMKEGRGRSSSGGNFLLSKRLMTGTLNSTHWLKTAARCLSINITTAIRSIIVKTSYTCARSRHGNPAPGRWRRQWRAIWSIMPMAIRTRTDAGSTSQAAPATA
jgi:hypothetical protein